MLGVFIISLLNAGGTPKWVAAHGLMTALCHAAATEIKGSERLKKWVPL